MDTTVPSCESVASKQPGDLNSKEEPATVKPSNNPLNADELFSTLRTYEIVWRDKQPFLEAHGYMLRPRLRPGWIPSWRGVEGGDPYISEDSSALLFPHLVDATRMSDGKLVNIKRVQTGSLEVCISTHLNSPPLDNDATNHCVPVLDLFQDDQAASVSYMVMPFLRLVDDPLFDCVSDILDLGEQLLEGLEFLHRNGVAHRDCSYWNLMMDGSSLYPHGFHPRRNQFRPDGKTVAWPRSRTPCPVRYYFIDFGISVYFPPDVESRLAIGSDGRDQEPPELSDDVAYDPFKLDVFILGNFFRKEIYDKYSNIKFLRPIWEAMTQADPKDRPSAAEALQRWRCMRKSVPYLRRRWRLKRPMEVFSLTLFLDLVHIGMTVHNVVRRSKTTKNLFDW